MIPHKKRRRLTIRAVLSIIVLFTAARAFMRTHGNPTQWPDDYPDLRDAEKDLEADALWVLDEGAGPVAVMSVLPGPDPTYAVIEGDSWLNDDPYWVMHRLAVAESGRGAGTRMLERLCAEHDNVRADTHADNLPMQRTLEKCGFVRRGTIYVEDGTPRIAYHFVRG